MTQHGTDEVGARDESEELNALTLTKLLNSSMDETLAALTPAELIELEQYVLKRQKRDDAAGRRRRSAASTPGPDDGPDAAELAAAALHHLPPAAGGLGLAERARPTGGQYMNLPASTPHVEFREGMEWLIFTYSTKGHIQEYHIRADIDDIALEDIPDEFKRENCVYPRALVGREEYVGNRYDYEKTVNEVAWRLCWRNPGILNGKRGLIQRAVDSYRNRTSENRSRRVQRQEKLQAQSPYNKALAAGLDGDAALAAGLGLQLPLAAGPHMSVIRVPGPKTLTLQYADRDGDAAKVKIRVDVDGVDLAQVDDDFRANNAVYPDAHAHALAGSVPANVTPEQWAYEHACNELGWKLAWLNSAKLAGKRGLLAKAVDAYHARMEAAERARQAVLHHHSLAYAPGAMAYDPALAYAAAGDDKAADDFGALVAQTLQQSIAAGGVPPAYGAYATGAAGLDGAALPPLDAAALHHMHAQMEAHHAALRAHPGREHPEDAPSFYGLPPMHADAPRHEPDADRA